MNKLSFKIISYGSPEYPISFALREQILRTPLGLSFHPEEFEEEKKHIHIAGFLGDELIAACVLVPQGNVCKMQRVAVKSTMQSMKAGSAMLHFFENHAIDLGFKAIYCHARATAMQFYLNNGYLAEGDYFEEHTIPHIKMRKLLNNHSA